MFCFGPFCDWFWSWSIYIANLAINIRYSGIFFVWLKLCFLVGFLVGCLAFCLELPKGWPRVYVCARTMCSYYVLVLSVLVLCTRIVCTRTMYSYCIFTPLVTMFLVAHTHCVRICSFIVRCTHNSLCVVALDTLSCIRCTHITPSYLVTLMFICIV